MYVKMIAEVEGDIKLILKLIRKSVELNNEVCYNDRRSCY